MSDSGKQGDLRRKAEAGEPQAQFQLGALLQQAGNFEEARDWFAKAAKAGHREALYTQATILLQRGESGPPTPEALSQACDYLQQAIKQESPAAERLLALLHVIGMGVAEDLTQAAHLLTRSALRGYPPAIREIGVLFLWLREFDGIAQGGGMLLRHAALRGDWIAAWLLVGEAARGRPMLEIDALEKIITRLRPGAAPFADRYEKALQPAIADQEMSDTVLSPAQIEQTVLQAFSQLCQVQSEALSETPNIRVFRGAVSPLLCDYLVAVSVPLLQPSLVVDPALSGADRRNFRTSDGAMFQPIDQDVVIAALARYVSGAAECQVAQGEFLSLLRYRPGQQYYPHHDFLPEDEADYAEIKACGQRKRTVLLYLNDGYEGGETAFPQLDITVAGMTGDLLLFDNVDAKSVPIPSSLHAGLPVTKGEKWLSTLWIREKPYWPWKRP